MSTQPRIHRAPEGGSPRSGRRLRRLGALAGLQTRSNLRIAFRYRADFLVGNFGTMVQAVAGVLAYLFLFDALGEIGGWDTGEWTLILGLVTTGRGVWNLFFIGTLDARDLIRSGKFDSYVLRPVPSAFLVTTSRVSPDIWGETLVGVFLVGLGVVSSGVELGPRVVLVVPAAVVIGTSIYYALFLLVQASTFWLIDNSMLAILFERLDEYSRVPLSIFPSWLGAAFSSVLPLAMVGYVPGLVIFGRASAWLMLVAAAVAAGFVVLALWCWSLGERRYSSSG